MNIQALRILGLVEGLSFLMLLFVAMPLKYVWGNPILVKYVGMGHGILVIAFIVLLFIVCERKKVVTHHVYCRFSRSYFTVWHVYF